MRLDIVDVWRGMAVLNMVVFHAAYLPDVMNGYTSHYSHNPIIQLCGHVSRISFMLLAGISMALARDNAKSYRQYRESQWERVRQLAVAAVAVTLVTRALFPQFTIYFGVLHFLTVAVAVVHPTVEPSVPRSTPGITMDSNARMHAIAALLAMLAFMRIRTEQYVLSKIDTAADFTYFVMGWPSNSVRAMDHFAFLKFIPVVLLGLVMGRTTISPNAHLFEPLNGIIRDFWPWRQLAELGRNSLRAYCLHWPVVYAMAKIFA